MTVVSLRCCFSNNGSHPTLIWSLSCLLFFCLDVSFLCGGFFKFVVPPESPDQRFQEVRFALVSGWGVGETNNVCVQHRVFNQLIPANVGLRRTAWYGVYFFWFPSCFFECVVWKVVARLPVSLFSVSRVLRTVRVGDFCLVGLLHYSGYDSRIYPTTWSTLQHVQERRSVLERDSGRRNPRKWRVCCSCHTWFWVIRISKIYILMWLILFFLGL